MLIIPHRRWSGGNKVFLSWFEDGLIRDLPVSLVWAIREEKEMEEEEVAQDEEVGIPDFQPGWSPHLSHRGYALCSQQGVLWLAHLVSVRRVRVKLRKWDWRVRVHFLSGLRVLWFQDNGRHNGSLLTFTHVSLDKMVNGRTFPPCYINLIVKPCVLGYASLNVQFFLLF